MKKILLLVPVSLITSSCGEQISESFVLETEISSDFDVHNNDLLNDLKTQLYLTSVIDIKFKNIDHDFKEQFNGTYSYKIGGHSLSSAWETEYLTDGIKHIGYSYIGMVTCKVESGNMIEDNIEFSELGEYLTKSGFYSIDVNGGGSDDCHDATSMKLNSISNALHTFESDYYVHPNQYESNWSNK